MKFIDDYLNTITMYRLMLNGLFVLVFVSVVFGFAGILPYGGISLLASFITLTVTCYVSNYIFSKIFKVQINIESSSITALILFFLLFPITKIADLPIFVLVGVLAMASKYILVIKKKHIFNPTAISIFIVGLFGSGVVSWWVGSSVMLIPVAILGFLILRKVSRFELFFSFLVVSLSASVMSFLYLRHGVDLKDILQMFTSGPIIFLGAIMLTEPLTTPPTKKLQMYYGVLVGVLYGAQFSIGPLYSTPEFALIVGNLFSYIVSSRARLVLTLVEKNKLSADVYDFVWQSSQKLKFRAGQYLEWTLGHKNPDQRGNRRYFTIASSPTEDRLHLSAKFYPNSSSFKKCLLGMEMGEQIIASQLSGEFVLSEDISQKLVFIAGGIGVTPFRSMVKFLLDKEEKRDIVLLYSAKTDQDFVYKDIFDSASIFGLRTIYTIDRIDEEKIKNEVPDYKERMFYISGPHGMVTAFEDTLQKIGVKNSQIKTDFFPGYV